jgi:hypothetical protein
MVGDKFWITSLHRAHIGDDTSFAVVDAAEAGGRKGELKDPFVRPEIDPFVEAPLAEQCLIVAQQLQRLGAPVIIIRTHPRYHAGCALKTSELVEVRTDNRQRRRRSLCSIRAAGNYRLGYVSSSIWLVTVFSRQA